MLVQALIEIGAKAAVERFATNAVDGAGLAIIKRVRRLVASWNSTPHPDFGDVQKICRWLRILQAYARLNEARPSLNLEVVPKSIGTEKFCYHQLTMREISESWFRTNTLLWEKKYRKISERWTALSAKFEGARIHYFKGRDVDFDYGAVDGPPSVRHPVFKSVHPFIMITEISRSDLGETPIQDVVTFFLDSWLAFRVNKYTSYEPGLLMKLKKDAYIECCFHISDASQHRFNGNLRSGHVVLWRCMMVTATSDSIYTLNIGIPATNEVGIDYVKYLNEWIENFESLLS